MALVQNGPATTLLKAVKIHVGNKAIEVPGAIYKAISADATYTTRQMITAVLDRFEVNENASEFELRVVPVQNKRRSFFSMKRNSEDLLPVVLADEDKPLSGLFDPDDTTRQLEIHRRKDGKKGRRGRASTEDIAASAASLLHLQQQQQQMFRLGNQSLASTGSTSTSASPAVGHSRDLRVAASALALRDSSGISTGSNMLHISRPPAPSSSTSSLAASTSAVANTTTTTTASGAASRLGGPSIRLVGSPLSHTLAPGTTLVGSCAADVDLEVSGHGVLPVHCEFNMIDSSLVLLLPAPGASVVIEGTRLWCAVILPAQAAVTIGTDTVMVYSNADVEMHVPMRPVDAETALRTVTALPLHLAASGVQALTISAGKKNMSYLEGQNSCNTLDLSQVQEEEDVVDLSNSSGMNINDSNTAAGDMPIETEVYTCSPNHHHSAPPMELPPCAEPAETETVAETEAEPVVPEITCEDEAESGEEGMPEPCFGDEEDVPITPACLATALSLPVDDTPSTATVSEDENAMDLKTLPRPTELQELSTEQLEKVKRQLSEAATEDPARAGQQDSAPQTAEEPNVADQAPCTTTTACEPPAAESSASAQDVPLAAEEPSPAEPSPAIVPSGPDAANAEPALPVTETASDVAPMALNPVPTCDSADAAPAAATTAPAAAPAAPAAPAGTQEEAATQADTETTVTTPATSVTTSATATSAEESAAAAAAAASTAPSSTHTPPPPTGRKSSPTRARGSSGEPLVNVMIAPEGKPPTPASGRRMSSPSANTSLCSPSRPVPAGHTGWDKASPIKPRRPGSRETLLDTQRSSGPKSSSDSGQGEVSPNSSKGFNPPSSRTVAVIGSINFVSSAVRHESDTGSGFSSANASAATSTSASPITSGRSSPTSRSEVMTIAPIPAPRRPRSEVFNDKVNITATATATTTTNTAVVATAPSASAAFSAAPAALAPVSEETSAAPATDDYSQVVVVMRRKRVDTSAAGPVESDGSAPPAAGMLRSGSASGLGGGAPRAMAPHGEELTESGLRKTGLLRRGDHAAERQRASTTGGRARPVSMIETAGLRETGMRDVLNRAEFVKSQALVPRSTTFSTADAGLRPTGLMGPGGQFAARSRASTGASLAALAEVRRPEALDFGDKKRIFLLKAAELAGNSTQA